MVSMHQPRTCRVQCRVLLQACACIFLWEGASGLACIGASVPVDSRDHVYCTAAKEGLACVFHLRRQP